MNEIELFGGITETALVEQYSTIKSKVIDMTVDDNTIYEATDFGKKITKLLKDADKARKEVIAPLEEAIAEIELPYKNLIGECKKLKSMVDGKISPYLEGQRRKQEENALIEKERQLAGLREEQAKLALQDKQEDVEALQVAVEHVESQVIITKSSIKGFTDSTVSSRKTWTYEIINSDAVRRKYCEPSPRLLNKAVQDGERNIEGVRIFEKYGVSYK